MVYINEEKGSVTPLLLPQLPSPYRDLSVYDFLQNKTYKEEGSLINPTLQMANFVDKLMTLFCASFKGIMYMSGVLAHDAKVQRSFVLS